MDLPVIRLPTIDKEGKLYLTLNVLFSLQVWNALQNRY